MNSLPVAGVGVRLSDGCDYLTRAVRGVLPAHRVVIAQRYKPIINSKLFAVNICAQNINDLIDRERPQPHRNGAADRLIKQLC